MFKSTENRKPSKTHTIADLSKISISQIQNKKMICELCQYEMQNLFSVSQFSNASYGNFITNYKVEIISHSSPPFLHLKKVIATTH